MMMWESQKIYPYLFIKNFPPNKHFFGRKGKEDLRIPNIFDCF